MNREQRSDVSAARRSAASDRVAVREHRVVAFSISSVRAFKWLQCRAKEL